MLAQRLTTILPAMSLADAIETTCIHRVAGLTGPRTALVTARLCRAPRRGMLLLDKLSKCRRYVL
jgi:magnesium chelatase family protein